MGKWSKYGKKYNKTWESEECLREWISPVLGDITRAACKFCKAILRAHHSDLVSHSKTEKHQRNSKDLNKRIEGRNFLPVARIKEELTSEHSSKSTWEESRQMTRFRSSKKSKSQSESPDIDEDSNNLPDSPLSDEDADESPPTNTKASVSSVKLLEGGEITEAPSMPFLQDIGTSKAPTIHLGDGTDTMRVGEYVVNVVKEPITASSPKRRHGTRKRHTLNPAYVGFIGCGNMAQALIKAFIDKGMTEPSHIIASAPSDTNSSKLRILGITTTNDNNKVLQECDIVFLCVNTHILIPMLESLNPLDRIRSPLFVSIVTGFDVNSVEQLLTTIVERPRVIRTMLNTPCMIGQGCSVYSMGDHPSLQDGNIVSTMLSAIGLCVQVPEEQMNAVVGLAASGPAYIYSAIDALADGGVKMGLPRQLAVTLAAQMVKGSASMVLDTGKHPGQLKDDVCSYGGGPPISGIHTLERHGFRNALMSAVEASAIRSKELSLN